MAVPAVPGAGKTTVLAYLAADLIASGLHEPGRILVVTYTNSAVGNLRGRIGDYLEERGLPRQQGYEVRTIHSLGLTIARQRPEALGWADNFSIIDEARLSAMMQRLTERWVGDHRAIWEQMIRSDIKGHFRQIAEEQWFSRTQGLFRNLIQAFKSRGLSPASAVSLTDRLSDLSPLRWATQIYGDYQHELAREGAVDFGDLMQGAHQLLSQDEELRARLRRRWTYIFEDEAQDSYRLQEQVLRLLAGPVGNLVRVGDANQAIMGTFTSAEPELFRQFTSEPGVQIRPLTLAGRSSPDIIDLANYLVEWTRTAHLDPLCRDALEAQWIEPVPEHLVPTNPRPSTYRIGTRRFDSADRELAEVARLAVSKAERSPEATLAILLPTNSMCDEMVRLVAQLGARVVQLGGAPPPEQRKTILDLFSILEYLAAPHMQATHHDRWLARILSPPDELVVLLAIDLGLEGEGRSIAHHLADRVRRLLTDNPAYTLGECLRDLRVDLPSLGRFADNLFDRKGFKPEPGVVYVSTCHAAKGLEWDTVFISALTRGEFPGTSRDKIRSELWFAPDTVVNPEALALAELSYLQGEERGDVDPVTRAKLETVAERLRLLYVAVTRARENLMLTSHAQDKYNKPAHPALVYQCLQQMIEAHQGR